MVLVYKIAWSGPVKHETFSETQAANTPIEVNVKLYLQKLGISEPGKVIPFYLLGN